VSSHLSQQPVHSIGFWLLSGLVPVGFMGDVRRPGEPHQPVVTQG
jgi:hypothetical protein